MILYKKTDSYFEFRGSNSNKFKYYLTKSFKIKVGNDLIIYKVRRSTLLNPSAKRLIDIQNASGNHDPL